MQIQAHRLGVELSWDEFEMRLGYDPKAAKGKGKGKAKPKAKGKGKGRAADKGKSNASDDEATEPEEAAAPEVGADPEEDRRGKTFFCKDNWEGLITVDRRLSQEVHRWAVSSASISLSLQSFVVSFDYHAN